MAVVTVKLTLEQANVVKTILRGWNNGQRGLLEVTDKTTETRETRTRMAQEIADVEAILREFA